MARPLIVEPNTERLQVVLSHDCATVDATNVALTVTLKSETVCLPVLDCADACTPPYTRAHNVPEGRWGGCGESNCGDCGKRTPTLASCRTCDGVLPVVCPSPSKTYIAQSVVRGVATFVIDHDLREAPAGWYLGRVAVSGCKVVVLTIRVGCGGTTGRANSGRRCRQGEWG